MGNLGWLITGGFLKGYRTYILAGIGAAAALAAYAVGDADLVTTINALAVALGLGTIRASVP